jgi:hypothetical protein
MKYRNKFQMRPIKNLFDNKTLPFLFISGFLTIGCSPKTLPLISGDKLRITSTANEMWTSELIYSNIIEESIHFENEKNMSIPISSIDRLKVKRGKKSKALSGALGGALLGGIAGAIFVKEDDGIFKNSESEIGFVTGMVYGSIIGTVAGALIRENRWKRVPINRLRISSIPNSNGAVGLGIGIAF